MRTSCLNWQTLVRMQIKRFKSFMRFARDFLSHWKSGRLICVKVFIATLICPPLTTAPEKRERGCCAASLLCWEKVGRNVGLESSSNSCFLFSRIEEPDWEDISPEVSPVRVWKLFLWDGRVASHTLDVFVSWQLHNTSWWHVIVDQGDVYMGKLAPAQVSYRDDLVISYHVYMMTEPFYTMFTWKLNQNRKHGVHRQRHVFRYCCSSNCFSHKFVKFVYKPYVSRFISRRNNLACLSVLENSAITHCRHKSFKKRTGKKPSPSFWHL